MSETKTAEAVLAEYQAAENAVTTAQKALEDAKSARDAKQAEAQTALDSLKSKIESVGSAVEEAVGDVVEDANAKLEEAKDEWAALAQTDPDAARRQLRNFWLIVCASASVVSAGVGLFLGSWLF